MVRCLGGVGGSVRRGSRGSGLAGVVVAAEDDLAGGGLPLEVEVEVDRPGAQTRPVRATYVVPVPE